MYLLYLDASGTPDQQDKHTKHYVLLGVSMPEDDWSSLEAEIQALKSRYCFPGESLELHVKQFAVWIREQDAIPDFDSLSREDRRVKVRELQAKALTAARGDPERTEALKKRFRPTAPYVHLTRAERSQLLEEAVSLIGGFDSLRLFCDAVYKTHPGVLSGRVKLVAEVFRHVVPRFDTFLDKKARQIQNVNPRGRIDHGLLILDNDHSTEATFHQLFRQFREQGHPLGELRHVIDVPFFAESEQVSGLQVADVCAYVVRRYLDKEAKPGSHEERQFKTLFRLFDRDPAGQLHGIRHYIQSGCPCLICEERGHGQSRSVGGTRT